MPSSSSASSSYNKAINSIHQTKVALDQIREALTPFLSLLEASQKHKSDLPQDSYNVAEAEAAVALAIGTLRFMARRMQCKAEKSNTDKKNIKDKDPIRLELDKIRNVLTELKQIKEKVDTRINNITTTISLQNENPAPSKKQRRI